MTAIDGAGDPQKGDSLSCTREKFPFEIDGSALGSPDLKDPVTYPGQDIQHERVENDPGSRDGPQRGAIVCRA